MRTRIVFLLFPTILFFQLTNAQNRSTLSGRVTDELTGVPLPGATVVIHDVNRNAVTDDSGYFRSSAIPSGNYLVEVSFIGYGSIVERIFVDGHTTRAFVLRPAVVEQEGVTVTGVSTATRIKQSPQPVQLIKRTELMKISSTNLINTLGNIAGVSASTTGPAISKPFIRGLGYNRVLVVHDGIRQEGQQWGDEHGIEIDDYSAQRVEVLKGPASLIYGSDGLAGVINIQTLVPVAEGRVIGNVLGEYQTNSRLRGSYASLAGTKNGFSFNLYGSYKAAQDYQNKYDGHVFNSKFHNRNAGALLGYGGSWGHANIRISHFDQQLGIIEGERNVINGRFLKPTVNGEVDADESDFKRIDPLVPFQHVQHFKIASDNSFKLGENKLGVGIGYQRNQRKEYGDSPEAYFDLHTLNYSARLNLPYQGNWKTSIGVSGMMQQNRNKGEEAIIPDYDLFDAGVFLFTQYHREKLSLSGGLRFDGRHVRSRQMMDDTDIKFEAFNRNFYNLSASAGISYELRPDLNLKLNIARGFRAPTLAELASNGAHEGTNRFELGWRELRSETSLQMDAGIDFNSEHITLGAGLFYNSVNDFIYYRKVLNAAGGDSLVTDPESGDLLSLFEFAQQDAYLYGVEFNMDIHPHPLDWLHFENTFSLTKARFRSAIDGSRNVPAIPAARVLSQLKGNFLPSGKNVRNLYASLESDYTFRQGDAFTGFDTETETPAYWLINASIGADFVRKGQTLFTLNLSAGNLTDIAYQSHLSRLKYTSVNNVTGRQGVFNAGRNFAIKLNVPLSFDWN
ncbi:MAG TPA: TonB-dependent receptor [Chitinophagaceae bacterium]|nr:TonB-dependent receptor [Chitinophagaceae bacterium]